jgi:hypothetical protein
MADGEDDPPPDVVPLHPRRSPRSDEARADTLWELMARREARIRQHLPQSSTRIPSRLRWWIAAIFIVAVVFVFRERIAQWLPFLGF